MKATGALRLLAVAGAGIAAFFAAAGLAGHAQQDDAIVAPATREPHAATGPAPAAASTGAATALAAASAASGATHGGRGGALAADSGQPFSPTSWLPPPPPPPKPVVAVAAPPAPPVAPPLPFSFVGLVEKGTPKPQAFLARGDELLVVSLGDVLDGGTYRIEALSASQIVFIHVPTNTKQIINLSGGSS